MNANSAKNRFDGGGSVTGRNGVLALTDSAVRKALGRSVQ
jgi:hypothetical protein